MVVKKKMGRPPKKKDILPFVEKSDVYAPETIVKVANIIAVPPLPVGPRCHVCGDHVAPGQSEVCAKHIRVG